jgi:hypothetical protein
MALPRERRFTVIPDQPIALIEGSPARARVHRRDAQAATQAHVGRSARVEVLPCHRCSPAAPMAKTARGFGS